MTRFRDKETGEVVAGRVELEERGKPGVVLSGFNDGDGADVEAVLETTCDAEWPGDEG